MSFKLTSNPMKNNHTTLLYILGIMWIFTKCVPEGPNYTLHTYEGIITVTTDSNITSSYYQLIIHRSSSYSEFISLNDVNYKFLSNGNRLIIDYVLQNEVNGFLYADGEISIKGDSLDLSLTISQYTPDTTLYFRTLHEGTLVRVQ
jgi:hypothetical protein